MEIERLGKMKMRSGKREGMREDIEREEWLKEGRIERRDGHREGEV